MKTNEENGIGRLWVFFDRWRFYAVNCALIYFGSAYFNFIQPVQWHAYLLFSITTISALLDFRFIPAQVDKKKKIKPKIDTAEKVVLSEMEEVYKHEES